MKVFVVNSAVCNGCYNCQIVCKDEHCDNDWMPYAKLQPDTGQFWCKLEEKVRGTVPLTRISYWPVFGAQDDALRGFAPEVLQEREDGLIVIDPIKAAGRKDIAERFEGVYYNEELAVPQGCTGCAHLLDNGWTVPRCVDACPTEALRFGEYEDFAGELDSAERLSQGSHVYYLNLPKRFIGATVVDYASDEVVIGAKVTLKNESGDVVAKTETNDFGDFIFKQVEVLNYEVVVEQEGYMIQRMTANATETDVNLNYIGLELSAP
jgi:Fe-S-cluster-containing dehydrogenase component